jgi:hypothetical protein
LQRRGFDELRSASAYYWKAKRAFDEAGTSLDNREEIRQMIVDAYDGILAAETSCNFFWGSAWVHKSFDLIEKSYRLLDEAMRRIGK